MKTKAELKASLGLALAQRVQDGQIIGVGSGSSVAAALHGIARRVREEGLRVRAVVSSLEAEASCTAAGIDVLRSASVELDWAFDGADEVDPELNLIKGRGGAILRERMVAAAAREWVIVVDDSKLVQHLGQKFPVPVEIFPEALAVARRGLERLGATEIVLRPCEGGKDGPVITEYGHLMLDCRFEGLSAAHGPAIRALPGVVECGLFEGMTTEVLMADQDGFVSLRRGPDGVTQSRLPPLD